MNPFDQRFLVGETVRAKGTKEPLGTVLENRRPSALGYTLEVQWHRAKIRGGDYVNFQHPDDLEHLSE